MACSITSLLTRPSVVLMGIFFVASVGTNFMASGSPLPNDKSVEAHFNDAVKTTDDFIQRAKNTFTGNADEVHAGLTPLEIGAVVAGAVILGFILFCCVGYCLCSCVQELICCICCCKCCRD